MSNISRQNASGPVMLPASNATQQEWKGLTMDELKMRRAKRLVMREVSRANLVNKLNNTRDNVSQNGVRALLFNNNTIAGLKKADYALLGYKAVVLLIKIFTRRRRR